MYTTVRHPWAIPGYTPLLDTLGYTLVYSSHPKVYPGVYSLPEVYPGVYSLLGVYPEV